MSDDLKEQLSPIETIRRAELVEAYRDVFATASGKRVLFDIIEQCAIYEKAFTGENNATNFMLGLQEAGKRVISRLDEIDPRFYPTLLFANADLKAMDQAAADRAANKGTEDHDIDA